MMTWYMTVSNGYNLSVERRLAHIHVQILPLHIPQQRGAFDLTGLDAMAARLNTVSCRSSSRKRNSYPAGLLESLCSSFGYINIRSRPPNPLLPSSQRPVFSKTGALILRKLGPSSKIAKLGVQGTHHCGSVKTPTSIGFIDDTNQIRCPVSLQ